MINSATSALDPEGELMENFNVNEFIFTTKTITYNGKTVQLSNVNRIWLYHYDTTFKAKFLIKSRGYFFAIALLIAAYFLLGILGETISSALGLVGALILLVGLFERIRKRDKRFKHFGLVIETSSSRENLVSSDKKFIDDLFRAITKAMNQDSQQAIIANFVTGDINVVQDNRRIQNGDIFENITNSNISNKSRSI